MTDHFVEVPKKVLSPAAQAMLEAITTQWLADPDDMSFSSIMAGCAAAALREATNQCQNGQGMIPAADLYLIATELENTNG